jgi:CHASE2 domain-containing sensor protein
LFLRAFLLRVLDPLLARDPLRLRPQLAAVLFLFCAAASTAGAVAWFLVSTAKMLLSSGLTPIVPVVNYELVHTLNN